MSDDFVGKDEIYKNICASNNSVVENYITSDKVINSDSTELPMYSFTLRPSDIQLIREYNKEHSYDEFEMDCNLNKEKCLSNFITNVFNNRIEVNGNQKVININSDNSRCYNTRISSGDNKWCSNTTGLNN